METLEAITITDGKVVLQEDTVHDFAAHLHGMLFQPDDAGYDKARAIYNGMIDKHPALIARCENVADVITAVNFARNNDLLVSILGGGHNGPGLGLCNGGLVIDLSPMKGIRVDPEACTVRVGPGCRWGDVDHATHAFGLATVSGIIANTGVGGLTLGGGHGYLTRKYGLTIDNLLAADVVLADGRFVTASNNQHEDLFWALRGGGGNFGVVTSFLFKLHPVDTVYGGPMFWPMEQTEQVMKWYRDFLPAADEDLYGFFGLHLVPPVPPFPESIHHKKMCSIVWCYTGPLDKAEATFAPIRRQKPVFEHVGPIPYPALQGAFDALYPAGLQWYWKGDFIDELSDEAVAQHLKHGMQIPTHHSLVHLYPIDGAVHRVGKDETAWSYRDATWSMVIGGVDPDPANAGRITQWARDYWKALHPYSAGGAYLNFMMEEGEDRIHASYRDNYDRLKRIKARYDPHNLFRVNQNIAPATH